MELFYCPWEDPRGDPGHRIKTSFFCISADRGLKIYSGPHTLLNRSLQQKPLCVANDEWKMQLQQLIR